MQEDWQVNKDLWFANYERAVAERLDAGFSEKDALVLAADDATEETQNDMAARADFLRTVWKESQ